MAETHIRDINARFPAESSNPYQFEAYMQSGVMKRGLSLIAPDKKWLAGTEKLPRPPWEWRVDPDRTRDEPQPALTDSQRATFVLLHRLLTRAFATITRQSDWVIQCAPSVSVGGVAATRATDVFTDEQQPFRDPYYWAGFVVIGDGETQPSGTG